MLTMAIPHPFTVDEDGYCHTTMGNATDVIAGSNPHASSAAARGGRACSDIFDVGGPFRGYWSIGCNDYRIGPGTLMWIVRYMGSGLPCLGGFLVVTGQHFYEEFPPTAEEPDGCAGQFVPGILCGLQELSLPGQAIIDAGWPGSDPPFGGAHQVTNGTRIKEDRVDTMVSAVPNVLRHFIANEYEAVNGYKPHWV